MNGRPDNYDHLTRLISGLLDARLSEEERAHLELQLETDADARRLYMQMVDQHVELTCLVAPHADFANGLSMVAPTFSLRDIKHAKPRRTAWLLAAAAVLAAAFVLRFIVNPPAPPRDLIAMPATPLAGWSADFEDGSLQGWTGELVSTDLPAGSTYGIRAVLDRSPHGDYHAIILPENWRDGLAELTDQSTLHITYRLSQAAWLNVFMHTVPADPTRGRPSMFKLVGSRFPGAAGAWQTASIPFRSFERKILDASTGELDFVGGPPQAGELIANIAFSAPHDFDLIIDRLWITPDGEGAETIEPLR